MLMPSQTQPMGNLLNCATPKQVDRLQSGAAASDLAVFWV